MVDIAVYPLENPRIIEITVPQTEVTIQDLHNAVRDWEDSPLGTSFEYLIDTAGKEDLGGGIQVGITSTLNNAQVYFPPRSIPIDNTKTCSTADTSGRVLISSTSTFIADGLVRGDAVFNSSTGGIATILEVVSETELNHFPLSGGSRNDWQIGDGITTYNNPQCSISGGNLVAIDENGDALPPVLNSPLAQVVRTASSSATLTEQEAIQYASFGGGVSYDSTSPYSGTEFPLGTPQQPVNNMYDFYSIAIDRGFTTGYLLSNLDMPTDLPMSDFTFIGAGKDRTIINIPDAASISKCTYIDAEVTGYLDGNNTLEDCLITNLYYIKGYMEGCVLAPGTITLAGSDIAHFLDCYSGQPGTGTPTIDMGGSGQSLALRNYNGGIRLTNKSGSESVSVDLNSGQIKLTNSVTNGDIVARGVGKLIEDATGDAIYSGTWNGATIINETVSPHSIADGVWDKDISENETSGTFGEMLGKKVITLAKYLGLK